MAVGIERLWLCLHGTFHVQFRMNDLLRLKFYSRKFFFLFSVLHAAQYTVITREATETQIIL